jgi:thymidine kinase
MAKLYFRYGAMNSGKSTALMQVAHNYEERGMRVLLLKPSIDTKGGDRLVSRLGVERPVDIALTPAMDPFALVAQNVGTHGPLACVLTDESQFFTTQQAEALFRIAVELNIPVICYGLRADFSLKGFPGSTRLLELAHEIEEMKTICTCGRKAIFNGRKVDGEFVFEGAQVAIDMENHVEYQSLCAQCYFREQEKFFAKKQQRELKK